MQDNGVTVLVPVFRSGAMLPELHRRLSVVLQSLGNDYEILLVEDGGNDDSWGVIQALSKGDAKVRGIRMSRNYGQHNALLCGIRNARGQYVVTIDDDLQNPPEEIPKLLSALNNEYDVVYGTPEAEQHGLLRDLASQATKLALKSAMGAQTARKVSAFRAFRTHLRKGFESYRSPYVSVDVLLTWSTTRFSSVVVKHSPRSQGGSGYTLKKLITHALNMMTGFSTVPLQLASVIGFVFTVFGFGILGYVVIRYFSDGGSVPGFSFLASIIAIFSGAQLFALGIIGEYLARMHFRSMERPTYLAAEMVEKGDSVGLVDIFEKIRG